MYLVCDGVWEGINVTDPAFADILQDINQTYEADLTGGIAREDAKNRAFGRIFKEINLSGLAENASAEEIANYLTAPSVGKASRDNTTAVVVEWI